MAGIWVLSSDPSVRYKVVDLHHQVITLELQRGNCVWLCSAVYASPTPSIRENLWKDFMSLRENITLPWLTIGDFNEILFPSEVRGGDFNPSRASKFLEVLEACGLVDLGAVGLSFTRSRKIQGNHIMSKHLDRALACVDWRCHFPEAFVENLSRFHSDHSPVYVRCGGVPLVQGERPFRFQGA